MGNDNASLGKASLWTSIVGVVLPVFLAILVAIFLKPSSEKAWANALCGVLLVILELVALGCGIVGRRTTAGKAGLVISGVVLGLIVVGFVYAGVFFPLTSPSVPTSSGSDVPTVR
jgi:cytochrome bd-type quinol oxidase subunit 2